MADIKQTGNITSLWPSQMIRPVGDTKNSSQKKKKSQKQADPDKDEDETTSDKSDNGNKGIDEYA